LLETFRDEIRGVVVYDPLLCASINIASMLASLKDLVIIGPAQAENPALRSMIRYDLRGRFQTNAQAYEWAYTTLYPQMHDDISAIIYRTGEHTRDYAIAHRIFTFWVPGEVDGRAPGADREREVDFARRFFSKQRRNSPVMGYPYAGEGIGAGETDGVRLAADYAQYIICDCGNLSFHSGVPAPHFQQTSPRELELDLQKVYLAFVISDGDNMNCWEDSHLGQWACPAHSEHKIPLNWNVMPSIHDLAPGILADYYERANDTDCFIVAGSGVGYANPYQYGRLRVDPEETFHEYLIDAAGYMEHLDLTIVNPYHLGYAVEPHDPGRRHITEAYATFREYLRRIPTIRGFLADYARTDGILYEESHRLIESDGLTVPVFHALTTHFWPSSGKDGDIQARVDELLDLVGNQRPAFVHAFMVNWCFDPDDIEAVLAKLGDAFVPVRADELVHLYQKHRNSVGSEA